MGTRFHCLATKGTRKRCPKLTPLTVTPNWKAIILVCWQIWLHRNACTYSGRTPNLHAILTDLSNSARDLPRISALIMKASGSIPTAPSLRSTSFEWGSFTCDGTHRISLDGSWVKSGKGGLGVVFLENDMRIFQAAIPIIAESTFMSELLALEQELSFAQALSIGSPVFYTDCSRLVDVLASRMALPRDAILLHSICRSFCVSFAGSCVRKVPMDQIVEAHNLAMFARQCL